MRPLLRQLAALAVLLPAAAAAAEMTPHETTLYNAAKREGEVVWYTSQLNANVAESFGRAFEARYPGVKVNVLRATAQAAFQRVSAELKAGVIRVDMFSTSDVAHVIWLKREGKLLPYLPENMAKVAEAYRNADPDNTFQNTGIGTIAITYNTKAVPPAEAPKSWMELLDAKWKGRIATGHPAYSGYSGTWTVMIRNMYGVDYLKRLAAQNPQVSRSINDTVTMLNSGERDVAVGATATTAGNIAKGNPLGIIWPSDGTLLGLNPSGIMREAAHPNGAKLLMEYMLSVEAGHVMRQGGYESLRPEVPPPPGMPPLGNAKLVRPTNAELEKGVPEVKEIWRELFGN